MATTKSEAQPATRKAQASLDEVNAAKRAATLRTQDAGAVWKRSHQTATTQKNWTGRKDVARSTD
jgi:hypothetical protein